MDITKGGFMSLRPVITIDNRRYTFSTNSYQWFCSHSPIWRERNMLRYKVLNNQLTDIAVNQGYDKRLFSKVGSQEIEDENKALSKPKSKTVIKSKTDFFIKL